MGDVVEKDRRSSSWRPRRRRSRCLAPKRAQSEIDVKSGQTVKVGDVLAGPRPMAGPRPVPTAREAARRAAGRSRKSRRRDRRRLPAPGGRAPEATPPPPAAERTPPRAGSPRFGWAPEAHSAVPVAAAPSVRQLARELGLDIARSRAVVRAVEITPEDVKQYAAESSAEGRLLHGLLGGAPVRGGVRPLPTSRSGATSSGCP